MFVTCVPGQHPSSHGCTRLNGPTQLFPLLAGEGLLHSRVHVRRPLSHVTLHLPHM